MGNEQERQSSGFQGSGFSLNDVASPPVDYSDLSMGNNSSNNLNNVSEESTNTNEIIEGNTQDSSNPNQSTGFHGTNIENYSNNGNNSEARNRDDLLNNPPPTDLYDLPREEIQRQQIGFKKGVKNLLLFNILLTIGLAIVALPYAVIISFIGIALFSTLSISNILFILYFIFFFTVVPILIVYFGNKIFDSISNRKSPKRVYFFYVGVNITLSILTACLYVFWLLAKVMAMFG